MSVDNDKFMERIQQIDGKLRSYSRYFAFLVGFVQAEDLYQHSLLKLYERYASEPDFFSNNNSYIWCFGVWMMKNYILHEKNLYTKHITDLESEYCDVPFLTGYFPRPEPEAVRSEVRDMASQMPDQYRTIFTRIVQGYEMHEIADMLGLGKYALASRKHTMIETLGKAWRVPQNEREQLIRAM